MKRFSILFVALIVLSIGWAGFAQNREPAKDKAAAAKTNADAKDADEEAIRRSAAAFTVAYNAHDSKAVAELFALKAEFTDEDGNLIKGRAAIERDFAAMFAKNPNCKIEVEVTSIRVLTPNIALEEGVVRGQPVPDQATNTSNYVVVHVKVDGRWVIGSVSDFDADTTTMSANDHLQQLAWMVGDWLDENPDSIVKSSCRWDDSGNYLLHEFQLHIAGRGSASGSMRIGWDPLTRQLKSWTFDVDSGYAEGLWTRDGNQWMVKSHGVNASGEAISATAVYRKIDQDTMTWRQYDRIVGGKPDGAIPEHLIKRQPPAPMQ